MIFCLPQENSLLTNRETNKQGGDVYHEVKLPGYWPMRYHHTISFLKSVEFKERTPTLPRHLWALKTVLLSRKQSGCLPMQILDAGCQ